MRSVLLFFALLVILAAAALAQVRQAGQQPAEPVRIAKIRENLYFIRGPNYIGADGLSREPSDVGVRVTPEGVILVDVKYQDNVPEVLEQIRTVTSQPIRYIFNTHSHNDHTGGNAVLSNGIEIIAQHNTRENMLRNKQPGVPRISFTDEAEVTLGGVTVEAHYFGRGHTNGDSVIYFRDLRVIHAGDLLMDGTPYIDYTNGGSALELVKVLDQILKFDFDVAIPGHGRLRTKDDVRDYLEKFRKMNQHMTELVKKGVPKAQAIEDLKRYLKDLGWDHTMSTNSFVTKSLDPFYDEIAAANRN